MSKGRANSGGLPCSGTIQSRRRKSRGEHIFEWCMAGAVIFVVLLILFIGPCIVINMKPAP